MAVLEVRQGVLDAVLLIQFEALERPGRHRARRQEGYRRIGSVVGVLLRVVMAGGKLDALVFVDAQAELAANVVGVGVEQVALAGFGRDAMAVGVEGGADMPGAEVQGVVHLALGAGEVLLQLAAEAVVVQLGQRGSGAQAGFRAGLAAGRAGGDVDDAAGGAGTVDRAAAVDHLDALDQRRVDVRQVARRVAVGVQRNAVDQNQHGAATQGLAEVGDGAAGVRHAGNALRQQGRQAVGALAQFFQLLTLDDVHLAHLRHQAAGGARGGHFHCVEFHRLRHGFGGAGCRGLAGHHDIGVLVLLLDFQAAVAQQALQCLLRRIAAAQGRGGLAGGDVAGEEDLRVGLLRNGIQRRLQGSWRKVEVDFSGLRQRRQAEQQSAGQQGKAPGGVIHWVGSPGNRGRSWR
ncbi:hypothetical protein D3C76_841910 [compost metagenome]